MMNTKHLSIKQYLFLRMCIDHIIRGFNVERQQTTILNPTLSVHFEDFNLLFGNSKIFKNFFHQNFHFSHKSWKNFIWQLYRLYHPNKKKKTFERCRINIANVYNVQRLIYYSLYVGMAIKKEKEKLRFNTWNINWKASSEKTFLYFFFLFSKWIKHTQWTQWGLIYF